MWKAKFIFKDGSKEELLCSRCEAIKWQTCFSWVCCYAGID
jgi:hypothetical protein